MRWASFFLLLTGCGGYHLITPQSIYKVCVPFIEGDKTGAITQAVTTELVHTGLFRLCGEGAPYQLTVKIVEDRFDDISYQYDVEASNQASVNRLVPNQSRRTVKAFVSLENRRRGCCVIDAFEVSSSVQIDYVNSESLGDLAFNLDGVSTSVLDFSLGQLDSVEGARANSVIPLARDLAHKISEGLSAFLESERSL